jgi:hypothetical protein
MIEAKESCSPLVFLIMPFIPPAKTVKGKRIEIKSGKM